MARAEYQRTPAAAFRVQGPFGSEKRLFLERPHEVATPRSRHFDLGTENSCSGFLRCNLGTDVAIAFVPCDLTCFAADAHLLAPIGMRIGSAPWRQR